MVFNAEDEIRMTCNYLHVPPFRGSMTFFYDETGNCRKFSLKNGKVNAPELLDYDFILGGIAYEYCTPLPDVDDLFRKLKLQKTQKELKYKHLSGNCSSFFEVLGRDRVTTLLDWLISNGLFIHFSTLNNFYYALVDIVDSLFPQNRMVEFQHLEKPFKSVLFRFVSAHRDSFLPLLSKYDYPNIDRARCKTFCFEFADYIQANNDDSDMDGFFLETIRQMLRTAGRTGELVLLHDNKPETLMENYHLFYHERYMLFPDSFHFFDKEPFVEGKLSSITTTYKGVELKNFEFVESSTNRFIQVSDAFIGLMGHLFHFLDRLTSKTILSIKNGGHQKQRENLIRIATLINRSSKRSPLFIKNCDDIYLVREREHKLALLCYG